MTKGHSDPAYWLDEHAPKLLAYARQWVGCQADAEDVFQEAFVRFWRHRTRARDSLTYLYRCVRNTAMNWRRDRDRRQRRERREELARPAPIDPAARAERAERHAIITDAVGRLPREQREIVAMKVWGEMSFDQIAEVTALPRSTAHARYRTAMRSLWSQLGKESLV